MKKLLFFLVLGTFIMQSCHKDNMEEAKVTPSPDPSVPATQKRLVSVQYQYPGDAPSTESFEYDALGRVVKYDDGEDIATTIYSGNQIEITEIRSTENNREVFHFTGLLDAAGRVIGGTATSNYNINTVNQRVISLEYDANGYLKKATMTVDDGNAYENFYTWQNGNLAKVENYTNGVKSSTNLYKYGSTNPDRTPYTPFSFLPGCVPNGKKNTQMWTSYTSKYDGSPDFTGTAIPTYDAEGYNKSTLYEYSNGNSITYNYNFK
ncbi:MAG: hypothetical protein IPL65_20635 [Lewinellaceae bacterium]|nr:hypothetical protein [Lewinellaceae bacterium]